MIENVKVGGILSHSTVDWYGHVASVIFFSGCQLRCPWCQNPSLVRGEGEIVPADYVVYKVLENRKLIDGVVLTGGEPTLQFRPLIQICKMLREKRLDIKLDTNGSNPNLLRQLVEDNLIQAVSIDFKAPLDDFEKYCEITGTKKRENFENFKESILFLEKSTIDVEYRTTLVPNLNDSKSMLEKIASRLNSMARYVIQQFSNENDLLDPKFKEFRPQTVEKMMKLGKEAKSYLNKVYVRTLENGEICI